MRMIQGVGMVPDEKEKILYSDHNFHNGNLCTHNCG
jgi:hypothetical protein